MISSEKRDKDYLIETKELDTILSLSDYMEWLSIIINDLGYSGIIYRGLGKNYSVGSVGKYGLISSIGQYLYELFSSESPVSRDDKQEFFFRLMGKVEDNILDSFERKAYPEIVSNKEIDASHSWEFLAFARHHGLPTRMMDWTTNPLVALYFAVSEIENIEEDGYIFIMPDTYTVKEKNGHSTIHKPIKYYSPKNILERYEDTQSVDADFIYYPRILSDRVRAQGGVFVVQEDISKEFDHDSLKVLKISAEAKFEIYFYLDICGVNSANLFPGIEGAIQYSKSDHYHSRNAEFFKNKFGL